MSEISHSKNIVTGHIDAQGNVVVGDTIINLKEAAQYKAIEAEIAELNIRFERTQKRIAKDPDDTEFQVELLEIDAQRSQKQQELDTLRREVLKLAEDFQRIPLNTERLRRAKAHFEQGEFAEARAVLDVEVMGRELDALEQQESQYQDKLQEIQQHKADKANEYLILARLTATNYELPDWYEKTISYFDQSLRAERNAENVFAFAHFLQEHNQFGQAQSLYEGILLLEKENSLDLDSVAMTLNNLGIIHSVKYEFVEALSYYQKSLQIYRSLVHENKDKFLPYVAQTLNNIAISQKDNNDFEEAKKNFEEALQIRRLLSIANPKKFLVEVSQTLNNIGNLHSITKELTLAYTTYEEALQIRRKLVEENSIYLYEYANTLNNLAILQYERNDLEDARLIFEDVLQIWRVLAEENPLAYLPNLTASINNLASLQATFLEVESAQANYQEALHLRKVLAQQNPKTYLPYVAQTCFNLALFYAKYRPDQEQSIFYCREAIITGLPFAERLPFVQNIQKDVLRVIAFWGEDPEAFLQNTLTQMNEQPSP